MDMGCVVINSKEDKQTSIMVKLGDVIRTQKGKKPKVLVSKPEPEYLPYIDIKAFEQNKFDNYTDGEKCLPCDEGDLLIVWDGARCGLTGLAHKGYVGSTLQKIWIPNVDNKYLLYFLRSKYTILNSKNQGSGTPHIKPEILMNFKIPLPPLAEQHRIVAKIEELFAELDRGIASLEKAKAQLKTYRQAVLKSAFEGEFTSEWRENKHLSHDDVQKCLSNIIDYSAKFLDGNGGQFSLSVPTEWEVVKLGNLFRVDIGATPSRKIPSYWNGDINWVSSGEVTFNHIKITNEKITEDGLSHSSTHLQPIGTVLLAMIGEGKTRGQAAILDVPAAHNQNTAAILVSLTSCSPEYVYYYLFYNYENLRRVGSGNNQKALNKERVRSIKIPFTTFEEQQQIVSAIETRLSFCDSLEKSIDSSLKNADLLRMSILKKAFAGELLKQDPADAPSLILSKENT